MKLDPVTMIYNLADTFYRINWEPYYGGSGFPWGSQWKKYQKRGSFSV